MGFVDGKNLYRAYFVPRVVDPEGLSSLPDCPLKNPGTKVGDNWCSEGHSKFHPPSKECFRSYASADVTRKAQQKCLDKCKPLIVKGRKLRNWHECIDKCFADTWPLNDKGQQCCYDWNSDLITVGTGAGTPDSASVTFHRENKDGSCIFTPGVIDHFLYDVVPWMFGSDSPPNVPPGSTPNTGVRPTSTPRPPLTNEEWNRQQEESPYRNCNEDMNGQ